ncbi:hypothetical protein ND748_06595 [Frankia sp. AiPs1]|uniref:hypothetical protein n=1 Tax=Frankia sp. AiPs1 TaxID=573493 RepID=UPI0020430A73|nr:hypothetical protein [Frankia sp. AiPs1]MCM3921340.1 hypothetical protein [Frankia sp. AiPs1]
MVLRPGVSSGHGDLTFTYELPGQPADPAYPAAFRAHDGDSAPMPADDRGAGGWG